MKNQNPRWKNMTESHAIGLWKIKTQTAQINSAVCLFQSWFWLNYTASQHGSSQRLRCLIWTYRNLWGCFRGGVFPYIGRIHSAYIGGDSSILGTCNIFGALMECSSPRNDHVHIPPFTGSWEKHQLNSAKRWDRGYVGSEEGKI